jgi:hypothetical protein
MFASRTRTEVSCFSQIMDQVCSFDRANICHELTR